MLGNRLGLMHINRVRRGSQTNIDINLFSAINSDTWLDIQSYVKNTSGNDQVLHPAVLYFENGWNGYKYWMAFTPYPNNATKKQNPSIIASNDNINWVIPATLTNPIVAQPSADGYPFNSDPQLIMSLDGLTMYCIYRIVSAWNKEQLWIIKTTDGVNWVDNKNMLTFMTPRKCISPSIIYKDGLYHMWYNGTGSNTPRTYMYRTSQDLITWSDEQPTDIGGINISGTMHYFWHIDVIFHNNYYWVVGSMTSANQYSGNMYIGYSPNGITDWTISNNPILYSRNSYWDRALYRASILPSTNNSFDMWYSTVNAGTEYGRIAYTKINYNT